MGRRPLRTARSHGGPVLRGHAASSGDSWQRAPPTGFAPLPAGGWRSAASATQPVMLPFHPGTGGDMDGKSGKRFRKGGGGGNGGGWQPPAATAVERRAIGNLQLQWYDARGTAALSAGSRKFYLRQVYGGRKKPQPRSPELCVLRLLPFASAWDTVRRHARTDGLISGIRDKEQGGWFSCAIRMVAFGWC